jgi:uncharacterized DUF497 family protein
MLFSWDPQKAEINVRKHGVSFDEAASALRDSLSRTIYDPDHSRDEDRFITLGTSVAGRLILVVHCDRGDVIRIISARQATRGERRSYEENP